MGLADRAKIVTDSKFKKTMRFNPSFISLFKISENDPNFFKPETLFELCTDIRFKSFVELLSTREVRIISEQNIPFKTAKGKTIYLNLHGTSSSISDSVEIQFEDVTEIGKSIEDYEKQINTVINEFNQEMSDIATLIQQRLLEPFKHLRETLNKAPGLENKTKEHLLMELNSIQSFFEDMAPQPSKIETYHNQKSLTELLVDIKNSCHGYLSSRDIKLEIKEPKEIFHIETHDKIEAFFTNLIYHISELFDDNSIDPLIAASQEKSTAGPIISIYANVHDPSSEGISQLGEKSSPDIQFSQSTSYLISLSKLLGYRIEVSTSRASTLYKVQIK